MLDDSTILQKIIKLYLEQDDGSDFMEDFHQILEENSLLPKKEEKYRSKIWTNPKLDMSAECRLTNISFQPELATAFVEGLAITNDYIGGTQHLAAYRDTVEFKHIIPIRNSDKAMELFESDVAFNYSEIYNISEKRIKMILR